MQLACAIRSAATVLLVASLQLFGGKYAGAAVSVRFEMPFDGFATLVVEEAETGRRVRNLVSAEPFHSGANEVTWDGLDDFGRDAEAVSRGEYGVTGSPCAPGRYRVRGLVRKALSLSWDFSIYAPGTPPWNTPIADKSAPVGAWLAEHTTPASALRLPKGEGRPERILLGCNVAEGPWGVVAIDPSDDHAVGGRKWLGGHYTAAEWLALDSLGGEADTFWAGAFWPLEDGDRPAPLWKHGMDAKRYELRFTAVADVDRTWKYRDFRVDRGGRLELRVRIPMPSNGSFLPPCGGLAVRGGVVAFSLPTLDAVVFLAPTGSLPAVAHAPLPKGVETSGFPAGSGAKVSGIPEGWEAGAISVPSPRGIAWDADGSLWILSGRSLVCVDSSDSAAHPRALRLGASLEDPRGLLVADGPNGMRFFVSDRGKSHQVKAFAANGTLVRAFGHPGAPTQGRWNPRRMTNPHGMALDGRGRLWVCEEDFAPKRVSVWDAATGALLRDFVGSPKYGGGGSLSPDGSRLFYADGATLLEFKLDEKAGEGRLMRVLARPDGGGAFGALPEAMPRTAPERPLAALPPQAAGPLLSSAWNGNPVRGPDSIALGRIVGDRLVPVFAAWAEKKSLVLWTDLDGDGCPSDAEKASLPGKAEGLGMRDDATLLVARWQSPCGLEAASLRLVPSWNGRGLPIYDPTRAERVFKETPRPVRTTSGGNGIVEDAFGNAFATMTYEGFPARSISGGRGGHILWTYPSLWPSLHDSHRARPPDTPSQIVGTTRLLGPPQPLPNAATAPLVAVNGNGGCIYLFTTDGLFVDALFGYARSAPGWRFAKARRGMDVSGVSLGAECFFPTFSVQPDGSATVVCGHHNIALVRVGGLDSLRTIDTGIVELTEASASSGKSGSVSSDNAAVGIPCDAIVPNVDGDIDDWKETVFFQVERGGGIKTDVALRCAAGTLFAAFRTNRPRLADNAGSPDSPALLFKTGGALDLRFDAPRPLGPVRLLAARLPDGSTQALLYRRDAPFGAPPESSVPFSSPSRTIWLGAVEDVSDKVRISVSPDGLSAELSVPLAVVGLGKATPGLRLRGDVGILRGECGETISRSYHFDHAAGIVEDIPAEAEILPSRWGEFLFGTPDANVDKIQSN